MDKRIQMAPNVPTYINDIVLKLRLISCISFSITATGMLNMNSTYNEKF